MAATIIGTTVAIAASTVTGYIVQDYSTGGSDVDFEDVYDEDGARVTRIVFQIDGKLNLDLITTTGTPETDFPEGGMCTVATPDLGSFFVDSCVVSETKGAERVQVSMTNIGIGDGTP